MSLVKLTVWSDAEEKKPVWVNPERILFVKKDAPGFGTLIGFGDCASVGVHETEEEVVAAVSSNPLTLAEMAIDLAARTGVSVPTATEAIRKLAGL